MTETTPPSTQLTRRTLRELSLLAWGCLAMSLFWFVAGAVWSGRFIWPHLRAEIGFWIAMILFGSLGLGLAILSVWPQRQAPERTPQSPEASH